MSSNASIPSGSGAPIIGVSTATNWQNNRMYSLATRFYATAVFKGGGHAVYLPTLPTECVGKDAEAIAADMMKGLDGLLLSGGNDDVQPQRYGECAITGFMELNPERDEWELALIKAALELRKPVLGICRGCQILNVAFGGTLYQDVHTQVEKGNEHQPMRTDMCHLFHSITVTAGSRWHGIFGEEVMQVNSFHNQAVKQLGDGLTATAVSEDGIVEVYEADDYPFVMGVQCHPEALVDKHPHFARLFEAFVRAAKGRSGGVAG